MYVHLSFMLVGWYFFLTFVLLFKQLADPIQYMIIQRAVNRCATAADHDLTVMLNLDLSYKRYPNPVTISNHV